MSFDIFLMCVRNGEQATFKRELIEEIMGRGAVNPQYPLWNVDYIDGSGSAVYGADDDEIAHLMFNHSGGEIFFDRLWELVDRTGSFLIWPDLGYNRSVAATRQDVRAQMFPGINDHFGPAFVVRTGKELAAAIFSGIDPLANADE